MSRDLSYFGAPEKASGGMYVALPGTFVIVRSLSLNILATPKSAILACMVSESSTLFAVRSRWMMGSQRSWRKCSPLATSSRMSACDVVWNIGVSFEAIGERERQTLHDQNG